MATQVKHHAGTGFANKRLRNSLLLGTAVIAGTAIGSSGAFAQTTSGGNFASPTFCYAFLPTNGVTPVGGKPFQLTCGPGSSGR